jgi:hypothetical protein
LKQRLAIGLAERQILFLAALFRLIAPDGCTGHCRRRRDLRPPSPHALFYWAL